MQLAVTPAANFDLIYPLEESVFPGSMQTWVGQYKKPGRAGDVHGAADTRQRRRSRRKTPIIRSCREPGPRRAWMRCSKKSSARARIRRPSTRSSALSRKYKFVTPYTSFLAAPRALLRPRLIRPGDPVLRVKTDESITSVVAMFPFGLVKKLRYLTDEDTWQTRFLAPKDLADGTYRVRLLLRDRQGRVFRESKTFVIASQPPMVKVQARSASNFIAERFGEAARERVGHDAHHRRADVRRGTGVPALECGDGIEHWR